MMTTDADTIIANLTATTQTQKCRNTFFRQAVLKSLHDTLSQNVSQIKDAIRKDTAVSNLEAEAEVVITLSIIKEHYAALEPERDLEEEYRVAKGRNVSSRQVEWGVVLLEPQLVHTPLFSVMSPLSAALTAGNCVALKLENNTRALPTLLRKLLPESLESDIFTIISTTPSSEYLSSCLHVKQRSDNYQSTYSQLVSTNRRVIAVVDRTGDLNAAADDLVTARFAFGGTSPYAPDLVLVNEFVMKKFMELVLQRVVRYMATANDHANGSADGESEHKYRLFNIDRIDRALESVTHDTNRHTKVITKGDTGAVIELVDKTNKITALPPKISEAIFAVLAITSPDHAIDLIASATQSSRLLASYVFAAPEHAKYLTQYISADASFVNHVPARLLLGPAAPQHVSFDVNQRYTVEHFTRAAPVFVSKPAGNDAAKNALDGNSKVISVLMKEAVAEIKEKKRPDWIAHGFFEQGIFIGLGVYGIPLVICIGAGLFYAVRFGVRRFI